MYVVCGINIINNVIANYRANYLLLNIIPDSITDWTCQLYAGQNIKYFYFPQNIFEIREDKDWTVTGSTDCVADYDSGQVMCAQAGVEIIREGETFQN